MRGRLLRTAVGAIVVAMFLAVGALAAPAGAATTHVQNLVATIDCTSLSGGYYQSTRLTASVSGLTPSTTYDLEMYSQATSKAVGDPVPLTTDATGAVAVDTTLSGSVAASGSLTARLMLSGTEVERDHFLGTACASGVSSSGTLTAAIDCPTRYSIGYTVLSPTVGVTGTLGGFASGQTYILSSNEPDLTATAVADPNGMLSFALAGRLPSNQSGWSISTSSQALPVATGPYIITNPCPALVPARPLPQSHHVDGDVTGDGLGDLLAIDYAGRLRLYQNSGVLNHPFTSAAFIGSGWTPASGLSRLSANDLTGDGFAEILAVRSDGALIAYYNNIGSNPGRMPYTTGTVIGSGWQGFSTVTLGDVNGDGYADIIADRSDGTRWVYLNHYATNPGHLPFTSGVRIPLDGDDSAGLVAADLNGDGYTDLLGGSWWNPNRTPAGNPSPFPAAVGSGLYLDMMQNVSWAVGGYSVSGSDEVVIADTAQTGELLEESSPLSGSSENVIGSGWQAIRTLIP